MNIIIANDDEGMRNEEEGKEKGSDRNDDAM